MLTTVARLALAVVLLVAGLGHFVAFTEFLAQVPPWMPAPGFVVYASGVVEILLGLALLLARQRRPLVGLVVAAFFVLVFPGNVWQLLEGRDAFGLDSDVSRAVRLLFQPVLVVWALWCTGAWTWLRTRWRERRVGQTASSD